MVSIITLFFVRRSVILLFLFILCVVANSETALPAELSTLEKIYLDRLRAWINEGGNPQTVKERVLKPCSKLVMLTATKTEVESFISKESIDEYDYRAGFCMKATVNVIHPQPEFENKNKIAKICGSNVRIIRLVCTAYDLYDNIGNKFAEDATREPTRKKSKLGEAENPILRSALNNLSHEMTECAAYYTITEEAMRRSGKENTAKRLSAVSDGLLLRSRKINIDKTVLARMQLALKSMTDAMENNIENISVLIVQYGDLCKFVVEKTDQRLNYWVAEGMFKKSLISPAEREEMQREGKP